MIKCIVVDDEKLARDELVYMLGDYGDIRVVGEAENAIEALKLSEEEDIDLMFLDIKMPQISGIELARILMARKNPPMIIFVTAYDQFALEAFQVNAIDYLLKPIDKDQLRETIENKVYKSSYKLREKYRELEKLLFYIDRAGGSKDVLRKLTVHHNEKMIPLNFEDIIYITVEDKNTIVRTRDNKFNINHTLNDVYEKLDGNKFFRCHKSFIINLDYVDVIEPWFNATLNLKMKFIDELVPVSRSNVKEFKSIMNID